MKKTPLAKIPKSGIPDSGGGAVPPAPPPVVDSHEKIEQMHKSQDDRLDALFSGDDPKPLVAPEPVKKEEVPPPPPKEKKEDVPKKEPDAEEVIDFDRPPEGAADVGRESAAQKRAAENGKALRDLETAHQELKLERERLASEVETLKKSSTANQPVDERALFNHAEVVPLKNQIIAERDAVVMTQDLPQAGKVLKEKFANYLDGFIAANAADASEGAALDAALRKEITEDYREAYKKAREQDGEDVDPTEMDRGAAEFRKDVLRVLVSNKGRWMEMQEKVTSLAQRAREGNLAQGVEVYNHHEQDLSTALAAIPELPEAVIKENPYSVEATVATMVKDKAWKDRFERIGKDVTELVLGPKALSQADLDNMRNAGVDVADFQKKRQKKFLDNRRKLVVAITQALLVRGKWEETAKDAEAYRAMNGELDALNGAKDKKTDPTPPPAPPRKAGEFVSASEKLLADIGY